MTLPLAAPADVTAHAAPAKEWQVFISYSRASSLAQAEWLHQAVTVQGLRVFKDDQALRAGDRWLEGIEKALTTCRHFIVLLGTEGLTRWVGGETSVALTRYFSAHLEGERPQIVPVLMDDTSPTVMHTLLAQFQSVRWSADQTEVPPDLIAAITDAQASPVQRPHYDGCPYRGLAAFQKGDAAIFFGRERDVLKCLARLGDESPRRPGAPLDRGTSYRRWLSIIGGSGAGKSSLMRAGLMPLIEAGALSARTGYDDWVMTKPMLPGADPLNQLAAALTAALLPDVQRDTNALTETFKRRNDAVLNDWINDRLAGHPQRALLLVIDQFEEVFTQAPAAERDRFDALLAKALCAPGSRLHLLSTCRSDFAHRIAEDLPQLGPRYNDLSRSYTLAPMGTDDLRRAIEQPAAMAGLDVSDITEAVIADARDDLVGALPLVQHALATLWNEQPGGMGAQRLTRAAYEQAGRLAGMLARGADAVSADLAKESPAHQAGALELLLALSHYQRDGRHTRQHLPRSTAALQAGLGDPERGEEVLMALSGSQGLRLITISDIGKDARVDLIHEALLRTPAAKDDPAQAAKEPLKPYWPTLVEYLVANKDRDILRQNLRMETETWLKAPGRLRIWHTASWAQLRRYKALAFLVTAEEQFFLKQSHMPALINLLVIWGGGALLTYLLILSPGNKLLQEWIPALMANASVLDIVSGFKWGSDQPLIPQVVEVPLGSFTYGCLEKRDAAEAGECAPYETAHTIDLREQVGACTAFGVYEVTFDEYDYYVWTERDQPVATRPEYPHAGSSGWGRGRHPVTNVRAEDAESYVRWLSTKTGQAWRLPTEVEWEYAARADHPSKPVGTSGPYWWGNEDPGKNARANCQHCDPRFKDRAVPVGTYAANPFGLYDTVGNVSEWSTSSATPGNRIAKSVNKERPHVQRGGSWFDASYGVRAFTRTYGLIVYNGIGFRVCRAPSSDKLVPGAASR